jgi:pimeloyl-ACP methyl ester carboxylesterase
MLIAIPFIILSYTSHSNKNFDLSTQNFNDMDDTLNFQKVTSQDGTIIGFWKSGSGPPLLLIHGTTADHNRWSGILKKFEQHFTVYVPVLLLLGGNSPDIFRRAIAVLESALPGSTVVTLSGQQHIAMDTNPDLFIGEVLKFLME